MKTKSTLNKFSSKGFTLIELLIVIAVLGILAAGVLVAINPVAKINSAKDSTTKSDMSQLANAIAASYTGSNGATYPTTLAALVPGELKATPKQQAGATSCTDSAGAKSAGADYCYNGAVGTAVLWAMLPSAPTTVYCWDSTLGAFKTTATVPGVGATACP